MKCPRCNGQGFSVIAKWKCPVCGGSGDVDMTNEEWMNSFALDTKAMWLANTCRRAMWEDKYDNNDEKSTFDYWKEWLKKPHTVKE